MQNHFERYLKILEPLFRAKDKDRWQYLLALLRVFPDKIKSYDAFEESREFLEDLVAINKMPLGRFFDQPKKTHLRLHLLAYVHLTEMNAVYDMIANFIRLVLGENYSTQPFFQPGKKIKNPAQNLSPFLKIGEIKMLATKAGLADIGFVFDEFYFPPIRHAIAHSDYVIYDSHFFMLNKKVRFGNQPPTQAIPLEKLEDIIARAYDFYSAFFTIEHLHRSAIKSNEKITVTENLTAKPMIENQKLIGIEVFDEVVQKAFFVRRNKSATWQNFFIKKNKSLGLIKV